ncbi:MAG: SurA N-terminal domain-containing protein [Bacteroidaceae bacterium]
MATLQKIRTQGPLLVIVIGLALFAFIAGDAWKIFQPHQGQNDVGEINGETISAQEYQKMVDEYSDIIKSSRGVSSLNDDELTSIKDEVWKTYVSNKLIEDEAEKLGLTVSKAEVQSIIEEGTNPMLQNTPFKNPQTGAFDKDMLKKFLVDYAKMDKQQTPPQYLEYYEKMSNFWNFIEKSLKQNRLMEKYQALLTKSLISNPIEAKASFEARVNQSNLLLAAVPYASIVDSTIAVSDAELKELYNKKKEQFKQYVESRNIKYIDVQVIPSKEDRAEVEKETKEYTGQLTNTTTDYAAFIRSTGSSYPFADVFYSKTAYPADIASHMDSTAMGIVYGPYYNASDDSFNSFKILATAATPDSIQYRQILVAAEDEAKTKTLSDSIYNAIKGGADFAELAKKYSRDNAGGESNWMVAQSYENATLDADNTKYINTLNGLALNELTNIKLGQANAILQVLDRKAIKEKYKVAVIKRPVNFSKETYNKTYNDFSQFIATNGTLEKMTSNAEEAGYKLLEKNDFYSASHTVGDIKGTREALKWVFEAKPGSISELYECGESDRLLVVGVESVIEAGYRPLEFVKDQLKAEIIKDKKAEKIMADIKAKNISNFEQCKSITNVITDTVKYVNFASPTFVNALRSSEPLVGAYASITDVNKMSAPIKGNAGVFVFQVYSKEKQNEVFNEKTEEQTIANMAGNSIRQFFYSLYQMPTTNRLYQNAKVKDTRYLFF